MRVIIIGGGIVGTSIAYHLTKHGCEVVIVDEHAPIGIGSSRTFACINYFSFVEEPYFSFRRKAISFSEKLAEEVRAAKHFHLSGTLRWGDTGSSREKLQDIASRLQRMGVAVEYWTPDDVQRRLEPNLRLRDVQGPIIRLTDEGWIDSISFIGRLRQAAIETGLLTAVTATALHIETRRDEVCIATSGGNVHGTFVCLAAGSGTSNLTKELGYKVEVAKDPGILFTASVRPSILNHVVYAGDLHFRPDSNGRMMGGQTASFEGTDGEALTQSLRLAAELAKVVPSFSQAPDIQTYAVSRPVPADGLPIAGWLPELDRIYVSACHSGITVGPLLGMLSAKEMLGKSSALPTEFRTSRLKPAVSRTRLHG
ncbi:FAD-binding oxidoreductase [Bradyrhizobium sp. sBnM-33]|uniref:NAD(P)/FAD-dependent oxidoreductase n=1 Tax=Bradyrhizobium sp. sBnM-33 TaxID=2831780 RepID=UPI001BCAA43D|nr:FAD-binding oxidoreductase [Bradyrhizobium sp. sBnM-33]WOH52596.1 FAD-binding oxidoreductase [Bradyrhizobium sp. sBnM-33]